MFLSITPIFLLKTDFPESLFEICTDLALLGETQGSALPRCLLTHHSPATLHSFSCLSHGLICLLFLKPHNRVWCLISSSLELLGTYHLLSLQFWSYVSTRFSYQQRQLCMASLPKVHILVTHHILQETPYSRLSLEMLITVSMHSLLAVCVLFCFIPFVKDSDCVSCKSRCPPNRGCRRWKWLLDVCLIYWFLVTLSPSLPHYTFNMHNVIVLLCNTLTVLQLFGIYPSVNAVWLQFFLLLYPITSPNANFSSLYSLPVTFTISSFTMSVPSRGNPP